MFFTRIAWIAAFAALVFGVLQIFLGVGIGRGLLGPVEEALRLYATAPSTAGVIDQGIYKVLFAIALGTLAEISFGARRM
jgi:hypothetical protein